MQWKYTPQEEDEVNHAEVRLSEIWSNLPHPSPWSVFIIIIIIIIIIIFYLY